MGHNLGDQPNARLIAPNHLDQVTSVRPSPTLSKAAITGKQADWFCRSKREHFHFLLQAGWKIGSEARALLFVPTRWFGFINTLLAFTAFENGPTDKMFLLWLQPFYLFLFGSQILLF